MITWILFDQAKVQTHDMFSRHPSYSVNGKVFQSKTLEKIFFAPEYRAFSRGKIDENVLISAFIARERLDLSVAEFVTLIKQGIEPIDGMRELLTLLHTKYRLGALINEGFSWAVYKLEVSEFAQFFDEVVVSGDIGLEKPERDFYLEALRRIGARPDECIFVDDKKENCVAAEAVGIRSIVFHDPEQLIRELQTLRLL